MGKRIFTNASPKAVRGIYKVYGEMGARIRAIVGPTGEAVVEVVHPDIGPAAAKQRAASRRQSEAA